jgi:uncharacterized protein involved in outer membrane biogenesis
VAEKNRFFRRLLIALAAVIALVVAAIVVAPFVVPSDFIATQIAGWVRQKTGRDLRITGPISFSLLPRLSLVAHDLRLSSPPGRFSGDFLSADSAELALMPIALLSGRIEIEHLTLSHPSIAFAVDADGERNWIFRPIKAVAAPGPASGGCAAPLFASGKATIVDGRVSYRDDRSGVTQSAAGLDLALSLPAGDQPVTATGSASYNGEPVKLSLAVASPQRLNAGGVSDVTVDIAGRPAAFTFAGTIDNGQPFKATGAATFAAGSLRELLAWAGVGVSPSDDWLGAVSLAGKIDLAGSRLALPDAAISFDGIAARGNMTLTRQDRRFDLAADTLAIAGGKGDARLAIDTAATPPAVSATGRLAAVAVSRLPIGIAGLDALRGTGDIKFDLAASGKTLRQLIASLGGSARIDFTEGAIGSAGLATLMRNQLGPAVNDRSIPREIEYRSLSASATLERGVLHNPDLKLAGPRLSATGAGTLDLAARRIDYLWQPDIPGLGSARLVITGDWDNPDYKVEAVTITKGLAIPGLKPR